MVEVWISPFKAPPREVRKGRWPRDGKSRVGEAEGPRGRDALPLDRCGIRVWARKSRLRTAGFDPIRPWQA